MKSKFNHRSQKLFMLIAFIFALTSCKDFSFLDGKKKYDSFGNWPDYAGSWHSGNQLVGEKWANAAYLNITINNDGTFEGTYEGYYQSGSMGINVGIITVYYPVYDPDGEKQDIYGALDFDNDNGIGTFGDTDDVTFSLTVDTDGEIWFFFDSGFEYDMGYVE